MTPSYEDWLHGQDLSENTIRLRMIVYRAGVIRWPDGWPTSTAVLSSWLKSHKGNTRVTYQACLVTIYKWLVETGQLAHEENPTRSLRTPPTPRPRPRPLAPEELERALAAADERTRAFLTLGYLAGLRAHEIAKFHGADIDEHSIRVVGKGSIVATVPTHPVLWALAQEYPRDGYWFPPLSRIRRATTRGEHVQAQTVTAEVGRLFRSLGLKGAAHRTRHTYATTLLRNGANLRIVQDLMRHGTLATTAHYLGVSEEERSGAVSGLVVPDASTARAAVSAPREERPAVRVTSQDVRLCAEVLDELEVELLRLPEEEARALFDRGFNRVVAARVAERTRRLADLDLFERVTRMLCDGDVSTEDAIVECRTSTCALRRTPTLDLPGTSCEGCGAPRARAVGPVAGPECPPWCREHPVMEAREFAHVGEVAAVGGMTVELSQLVRLDAAGEVVVERPTMLVLDGAGEVTLPADERTLEALRLAVSVASS